MYWDQEPVRLICERRRLTGVLSCIYWEGTRWRDAGAPGPVHEGAVFLTLLTSLFLP
jgi:hypothetical protein